MTKRTGSNSAELLAAPKRVLLDTNVWRYLIDNNGATPLLTAVRLQQVSILVAPCIAVEIHRLEDAALRRKLIDLISRPEWTRIMADTFLECDEIINEVRRVHPDWLLANPDLKRNTRRKNYYTARTWGFWREIAGEQNTVPILLGRQVGDSILNVARDSAKEWRSKVDEYVDFQFQNADLGKCSAELNKNGQIVSVPLWRDWTHLAITKLLTKKEPIRQYLNDIINMDLALALWCEWQDFWHFQVIEENVPRLWLRWAFEYLQGFRKVTNGTPVDAQLAGHMLDSDLFITADRVLVEIVTKCAASSSIRLARPVLIRGGANGVNDLAKTLEELGRR